MSTLQTLTTEQVAILDVINLLEKYEDNESLWKDFEEKVSCFQWDSLDTTEEEAEEDIELLQYFKFLNADKSLSYIGRQYLKLSKEYVKNNSKNNGSVCININFTLLDVKALGSLFDITGEIGTVAKAVVVNAKKIALNKPWKK